jgi:hypothetical protein
LDFHSYTFANEERRCISEVEAQYLRQDYKRYCSNLPQNFTVTRTLKYYFLKNIILPIALSIALLKFLQLPQLALSFGMGWCKIKIISDSVEKWQGNLRLSKRIQEAS